ncbi:MAG: transcription elongation factor GreA [Candidatus Moranbacteria bacterium]|nr:transcription elongation factor GreA [Candidatus Moranbacteria bacterium]
MSRLITESGLKKLKQELEEKSITVRQNIANAIKEAKEQGDLSENAEYSAAKQQQAENEVRIAELEMMIKNAEVVKHDKRDSSAQIGSKVTVKTNGKEMLFEIVGINESDPSTNKISNESPIGNALIGNEVGDRVEVSIPNGSMSYEIVAIS